MLITGSVGAVEAVNYTIRFGSDNISKDGVNSSGSGLSLQAEVYLTKEYGVLATYGQSSTESNESVLTPSGQFEPSLSIENQYIQAGGFYYVFEGLRLAAGLSLHNIDVTENVAPSTYETRSESFNGVFANIAYSYRFQKLLLGAEYSIIRFDEYGQSGLALIIGLYF